MVIFDFNTDKEVSFRWCGKFQSPSPDWIHLTRRLIDFELMVVTSGTLYIATTEKEYAVRKGEYLLMKPTDLQYGHQASDCSFYWLHFTYNSEDNDPDILEDYKGELILSGNHMMLLETGTLSSPWRMIILMKQLQDSSRRYGDTRLNQYLTLAILAELSNQNNLYYKYGKMNPQQQLYHDLCDHIAQHINENMKVSDLASHFGYNKKYLPAFFRKHSGINIKQYMLQVKMDYAKAELTDTNHRISQVAYNIGFNDVHNFSIAFKKITGLSPSDYRNSYCTRIIS